MPSVEDIVKVIRESWPAENIVKDKGNGTYEAGELKNIRFHVFEPCADFEGRIAAIDGSSNTVLSSGSFLIGAVRAGGVLYRGTELLKEEMPEPELIFLSRENMKETYGEEYMIAYGSMPPSVPREFNEVLQRIRSMREMEAALRMLEYLEEGDIMLLDGALKADIDTPDRHLKRIAAKADERGVVLAGISKKSSVSAGPVPINSIIRKIGEDHYSGRTWLCDPGTGAGSHLFGRHFVVRFNADSDYVFRADIRPEERAEWVCSILSLYSNDPAYPGFPFPLADAHNGVIIKNSDAEAIAYRIEEEAINSGMSPEEWYSMFMDFHEVLDRGV